MVCNKQSNYKQKLTFKMEDANLDNVVGLVNTYTTGWKYRKSSEKKRGITRITQMSKQKYQQNPIIPVGNNQNFNNSNYKYTEERKQKIFFHQQVEKVEIQKESTQKDIVEKVVIQKEPTQKDIKNKEPANLVQSHYINCQQDVDQWLRVKQKLEQRINNLQIQNNFLKINVGIQQQYIIKIQTEVDNLRLRCQPSIVQTQTQTQQQNDIKVEPKNTQSCQIQCELQEKGYQQFQKFSREVEQQTNQFFNIIEKLQSEKQQLQGEKQLLINQNTALLQRLQKAQQRLEQQSNNRQAIKHSLSKQISNLVETEYNLKMRLKSFEESKEKMLNEVNKQKTLYEREKELKQQIQKQKQAILKVQMQRISNLQTKYGHYKKQLDELVSFLQQKNKNIKERQHKIQINKSQNPRQNKDLTNKYEDRVIQIKQIMENYLQQLVHYRIQKQAQQKKQAIKIPQVSLKKNQNECEYKQKQIGQDIGFLLQKIASLQLMINDYKREKVERQRQILGRQNLLEVQYNKINQLQQQNETIRLQLQQSTKECRDIQYLITTLQNQKEQLKIAQFQLSNENSNIKTQLIVISQQLQNMKQKCNADLVCLYALKEENQKQKERVNQLTFLLQNNSERFKRQLICIQQDKTRFSLQKEQLNRQVDNLKIQSIKQNNIIQSFRKELLQMSHKYEQMAKMHAYAKRQNVKLVEQNLQLKQKSEVNQRQIELIIQSHQQSIRQLQSHICKLQSDVLRQRQLGIIQKNEWQRQKQLVKRDYDILYNKYLKYKNIALQSNPQKH